MQWSKNRTGIALVAVCGLAVTSYGQVANPEAEPNENKGGATTASSGGAGMAAGDYITGNTTGTGTTAGGASIDYFRVKTAAAPLGIYRYRLVLTTAGTAGHTGTIRGLSQTGATQAPWNGVVGTPGTTDSALQASLTTSTPARFSQWYGFGKQEEFYYTVGGATATTSDYVATLERADVTPTAISGSFAAGSITISTLGQGHTTDTDFWVYDSALNPIVGFGNDDEATATVSGVPGTTGATLQSVLKRTYGPGTYYIAMSVYQSMNNLASPSDDDFRTGFLTDFPNIHLNGVTNGPTTGQSMQFTISDGVNSATVPNTHAGVYDVNWFSFTVGGDSGACCLGSPTYSCVVTSPANCAAQGGAYAGNNVTCAAANCPPPPSGRCCTDTGACSVVTVLACTSSGGVFTQGGDCSSPCPATVWAESGDAGDLPGTAQIVSGSGGLLKITGSIGTVGESDMYKINICSASTFVATTVGNGNTLDTILSLYKSDGTGVSWNDDEVGTTVLQSRITNLFVAPVGNGDYYLHVSQWNKVPFGANGNIWINDNSTGHEYRSERAPDGPGAPGPITGWNASTGTGTGTYTIALTGACFVSEANACYANCDGSTNNPLLTANDFQCFLNEYAANHSYANCDGSTNTPVLTANDFQCFLNAYAVGCS